MQSEPVRLAQISAAIVSVLSMLVALDVISLTPEQFSAVEEAIAAVLVVLAPLVAGEWARSQVMPVASAEHEARVAYEAGKRNMSVRGPG